MRGLIAYEGSHRSYGEVLAVALRLLRPRLEVSVVLARELSGEIGRFDPHVVVSGEPNVVDPGGRAAWVTLSEEPGDRSEACVGGRRREIHAPDLAALLAVLEEVEESLRNGGVLGGS